MGWCTPSKAEHPGWREKKFFRTSPTLPQTCAEVGDTDEIHSSFSPASDNRGPVAQARARAAAGRKGKFREYTLPKRTFICRISDFFCFFRVSYLYNSLSISVNVFQIIRWGWFGLKGIFMKNLGEPKSNMGLTVKNFLLKKLTQKNWIAWTKMCDLLQVRQHCL